MSHGKRYHKAKALLSEKKLYAPAEAIAAVKETAKGLSFDATVELHVRLSIDTTKGEEQVRGILDLPHGTGKVKRVAAFVDHEKEKEAQTAGADIVGGEELILKIAQSGKCDFEEAVATPAMMPKLAKIAKILGPKGLMPNPKNDTVGANIGAMIRAIKGGRISFKNDDTGNLHLSIGKISFPNETLVENLIAALDVIKKSRPRATKGVFIKKASLTTSMGPSLIVQYDTVEKALK